MPPRSAHAQAVVIVGVLVVAQAATLVIEDSERDPRCAALSPVANAGVRLYAGAPLRTRDGQVIGTLCVVDHVPRRMAAAEQHLLESLADEVIAQLDHHAADNCRPQHADAARAGDAAARAGHRVNPLNGGAAPA